MKRNTILIKLYSPTCDARIVQALSGCYASETEARQIATYSVENGMATIHELEPAIATRLNLPLPFQVPVTDLGSGQLACITIDADTLTAQPAICPKPAWAARRAMQPMANHTQTLMADYIGLL